MRLCALRCWACTRGALRAAWTQLLWPSYDCEFCLGQEPQHGCWCAALNCDRPGDNRVRWWRRLLRRLSR